MTAIAGIKSELAARRADREEAAKALDESHKILMKARTVFERDQGRVMNLNDRIEALAKALKDLGGSDGCE